MLCSARVWRVFALISEYDRPRRAFLQKAVSHVPCRCRGNVRGGPSVGGGLDRPTNP